MFVYFVPAIHRSTGDPVMDALTTLYNHDSVMVVFAPLRSPSPRCPKVGRRLAQWEMRSPCRGWWGWRCRTASSGAWWCWTWCPGMARHNMCKTSHVWNGKAVGFTQLVAGVDLPAFTHQVVLISRKRLEPRSSNFLTFSQANMFSSQGHMFWEVSNCCWSCWEEWNVVYIKQNGQLDYEISKNYR